MARVYSKKYRGVFSLVGKSKTSFGIDYIHPVTGERISKVVPAANEKEANDIRQIEMADALRGYQSKAYGLSKPARVLSWSAAVDLYMEWAKENKKSYEVERYKTDILKKGFPGKLLTDINPFLGERFKLDRAKVVSKTTANKDIILAGQVYKKMIEWQKYDGKNPFEDVALFKVPRPKKPGSLTPEEVSAIIEQVKHPIERDMVAYAYYTGWRISEITGLKWADLETETGAPWKGIVWIPDPKNGRPARIVLSEDAQEIIERQQRRGEYIFCKLNGEPWKTTLNTVIRKAAERAGVDLPPRKAWHIFRRTWASIFIQSGGDIATMQAQGNWRDPAMPLWYADERRDDAKRRQANSMPKLGNIGDEKCVRIIDKVSNLTSR